MNVPTKRRDDAKYNEAQGLSEREHRVALAEKKGLDAGQNDPYMPFPWSAFLLLSLCTLTGPSLCLLHSPLGFEVL